jgi:hypothetical protein
MADADYTRVGFADIGWQQGPDARASGARTETSEKMVANQKRKKRYGEGHRQADGRTG